MCYTERMKTLTLVLALLLSAPLAHAEVCTQKQNLTLAPDQPLRSAANGWLQWLNRSYTFTCSGTASHLSCSHNTELYTFDYMCDSAHCYVEAYEGTTHWRDEAIMSTGAVWNWTWDAGANQGRLQDLWVVCWPNNCSGAHYGTCD